MLKNKALSLLEILVSVVILALLILGMINLFVSGKRYILHSRWRMSGGEIGKFFLNPLQMDVRQDTWGNNCLSGNITRCPANQTIEGRTYAPTYTITPDTPIQNINRVRLELRWNENPP